MHNEEMKNRLSDKAIVYWRAEELITLIVTVLIFCGLLGCALYWDWPRWLVYVFMTLLVLCIVATVFGLCTLQRKFRHWTYSYDDHFFYIREGIWTKRLVMLPFEKMQAVTLIEGALLNQFNLAAIELQAIEKVYRVPALDKQVALTIQQELAELTKQKEALVDETIAATHRL